MRLILSWLLLLSLAGCASDGGNVAAEPSQTETSSPSQSMDPMESETIDPMESETMEPMESDEPESSASPSVRPSAAASASPAPTATQTPTPTPTPTQTPSATPTTKGYTMADVAKRNTQAECWVVIDNRVYDLTDWIRQHPGGSGSIRSLCGTDGTSQFTSQHGGAGRPTSTLNGYYLGPLAG